MRHLQLLPSVATTTACKFSSLKFTMPRGAKLYENFVRLAGFKGG
jgi:hypothetical protein